MKQLTIRGFSKDLERSIRELARREGISLNQAAVRLLNKGAGIGERSDRGSLVGDSLDHLAGTWSKEEEEAFLASIEPCEMIDESLWK